jgi:hypothetical protein
MKTRLTVYWLWFMVFAGFPGPFIFFGKGREGKTGQGGAYSRGDDPEPHAACL